MISVSVSVSVSFTAPKLAIFLVSVTAVIVKHGFGLPSAETVLLAIR